MISAGPADDWRDLIKHVLLGLIIERPASAHELTGRLASRIAFWCPEEDVGPLVQELLDELELEGVIASTGAVGLGRRGERGNVYDQTATADARFEPWFSAPSPPLRLQDELQWRIAAPGGQERKLNILTELMQEEQEALLRSASRQPSASEAFDDLVSRGLLYDAVAQRAAREYERRVITMRLEFLVWMLGLAQWARERLAEAESARGEP